MTAKELKEQVISTFIGESGLEYPVGSIGWMMKQHKIETLNKFIDQLCKEQLAIASEMLVEQGYIHASKLILNAKQPEL